MPRMSVGEKKIGKRRARTKEEKEMFYASRKISAVLVTQRVGAYWSLGARGRAQTRFQLAALIIACCQPLTTVGDACNDGIRVYGTPNVRACRPLKRHADAYNPSEYAG